jgi:putative membrane protein
MPVREVVLPIYRSRTLKHVAALAIGVGAYAALPVWKEHSSYADVGDTPAEIHAALTLVLGWLLVFRTNSAYNRWWEARTLWGGLVNASRNLAVKFAQLIVLPDEELAAAERLVTEFPAALRDLLREDTRGSGTGPLPRPVTRLATHRPGALVGELYSSLRRWKSRGWIDGDDLRVLDRDLAQLLDICGGCERIRRTRIAQSYRIFARQCVVLFLATLPWGICSEFDWWTIPLTAITSYFMLGLEIVAEHVEEPFGHDEDDLDLDGLCATIEQSVGELIAARHES